MHVFNVSDDLSFSKVVLVPVSLICELPYRLIEPSSLVHQPHCQPGHGLVKQVGKQPKPRMAPTSHSNRIWDTLFSSNFPAFFLTPQNKNQVMWARIFNGCWNQWVKFLGPSPHLPQIKLPHGKGGTWLCSRGICLSSPWLPGCTRPHFWWKAWAFVKIQVWGG